MNLSSERKPPRATSAGLGPVVHLKNLGHVLEFHTLTCIGCGAPAELIEDTNLPCVGRE